MPPLFQFIDGQYDNDTTQGSFIGGNHDVTRHAFGTVHASGEAQVCRTFGLKERMKNSPSPQNQTKNHPPQNLEFGQFTLGAVTLAILPLGKWLLPTGKQLFVCNRFSQSEIAFGKFPWMRQKEQKNFP